MRRRSPARWLAPLALVTCAVAIYAVVNQELLSDKGGAATTSTTRSASQTDTVSTTKRKKTSKKAKTYTVRAGDSFSAIAAAQGVDVAALQDANPDVDASALHPGQKLKLPR